MKSGIPIAVPMISLLLASSPLVANAGGSRPTVITLRPSAHVPCPPSAEGPCPLTLGAVAVVHGDAAEALSALTVALDARVTAAVDLPEVRAVLDRASVNWSATALNGARCTIIVVDQTPQSPAPSPGPATAETAAAGPASAPTLRTAILHRLAAHYSAAPQELRVEIRDPPPRRAPSPGAGPDPITLDTPLSDHRVEVEPLGGPGSARLPIALTVYHHDRILFTRRVVADILIDTQVVAARRQVERGRTITADDLLEERRWLAPQASRRAAEHDGLLGAAASTRIPAGAIIDARSVEAPLLVKRGDPVSVHCLSGAVGLRIKARALESGRAGDLVKFQADGSTAIFSARIDGQGRAVVTVDAPRPLDTEGRPE